jgi:hypothetical protein
MVNMSARVGELIRVEQKGLKATPKEISAARSRIVATTQGLQAWGKVRPGKDALTAAKVDVKRLEDCAKLRDEEMQAWLRETLTVSLAIALMGKEKGIAQARRRIFANLSARVGGMIRKRMRRAADEKQIRKCRSEIVDTIRDLQAIGRIRPPSRRPSAARYERVVRELSEGEIERSRHYGEWTPKDLGHLLPYIASTLRKGGVERLNDVMKGLRHPVLSTGMKLLSEKVDRAEIVRQLTVVADKELRRLEREYEKAIVGIAAIADGESPRAVGDRVAAT